LQSNSITELLSLAHELGVHQRTLRAAARTGRLQVTFSSQSAFGRPIRLATRAAGQAFMRKDYRRYGGQSPAVARRFRQPLMTTIHVSSAFDAACDSRNTISRAALAPRTKPFDVKEFRAEI
jgi:hypothetical protein